MGGGGVLGDEVGVGPGLTAGGERLECQLHLGGRCMVLLHGGEPAQMFGVDLGLGGR